MVRCNLPQVVHNRSQWGNFAVTTAIESLYLGCNFLPCGIGESPMGQERDIEQIRHLARQMASSGRFCSWRLIEIELRFIQGMREAADGFQDRAIRDELDALCRDAQKKARAWPSPVQVPAMAHAPAIPKPVMVAPPAPPEPFLMASAGSPEALRPEPAFAREQAPRWIAKYRA